MVSQGINSSSFTPPHPLLPAVLGQEEVKIRVWNAVFKGRLAKGYLITGPMGVGKRALAIEMARILNCEGDKVASWTGECSCRSCRLIKDGEHPHLIWLTPFQGRDDGKAKGREGFYSWVKEQISSPYRPPNLSENDSILVEGVREIRQKLAYRLDRVGYRCVVIYPAGSMNDNAANALLKILEEPPERTVFFILAESPRELLPTIVSRCQTISLKRLSQKEVEEGLRRYSISPMIENKRGRFEPPALLSSPLKRGEEEEVSLRFWASLAEGSLTRALQLTQSPFPQMIKLGMQFLRAAVVGKVKMEKVNAKSVEKDGELDLWEFIQNVLLSWWNRARSTSERNDFFEALKLCLKDAMMIAAFKDKEAPKELTTPQFDSGVLRMAERYSFQSLTKIWEEIEEVRRACDANVNPALAMVILAEKVKQSLN